MLAARLISTRFAPACPMTLRTLVPTFLCLALAAALAAAAPRTAHAAEAAGPFLVEGPAGAYAWDGNVLVIEADDVTIQGMADPSVAGDVRVAAAVSSVGIGDGVRIDQLAVGRTTRFAVFGSGNDVVSWQSARGDAIGGTGSIVVGTAAAPIDVHDSATVTVNGASRDLAVWERASLALGPDAAIGGILTAFGGTLDLSRVPMGAPVPVLGASIGDPSVDTTLIAPFGATRLDELLSYPTLYARGRVSVFEAGERVGTLLPDGSFDITATRTVTFVGFDGQPVAVEHVPLFQAAIAPDVSAPEGYEFVGWDRSFSRVTEDMAVVARFEKLPAPEPAPNPAPAPPTPNAGQGGTASGGYEGAGAGGNQRLPMNAAKSAKPLARTGDGVAAFGLGAAALGALAAAVGAKAAVARSRRARR